MDKTKISWTDATWNPITGCTKISEGCRNCYALRMAGRLQSMGQKKYRNGQVVTCHEDCLDQPLRWKRSRKIFVNSMSDIYHPNVPDEFIRKMFSVMNSANWHIFQILTKRTINMEALKVLGEYENQNPIEWTSNIWMGVSVENSMCVYRIDDLRDHPARVKFVSFEPLLGDVGELDLEGIDWVIVGGESGPNARKMEESWAINIRDQCLDKDVPFFFKQVGGRTSKGGCLLEGREWKQWPIMFQYGAYKKYER